MRKYLCIIIFSLTVLVSAFPLTLVHASNITVRPFLLDLSMTPREDSQNLVTIKNNLDSRKVIVYATVNEITVGSDGEIKEFITPVMTDRTNTVTSWIEVSRGRIEIPALESREIPLTVKLHPYAQQGEYHVFIGFVEAPNRPKAESIALAGEADGVIVKITVEDERNDSMRISSFTVERFVTGDDKRNIDIELENMGDVSSAPQGEIIFYDSRGIEVGSLPIKGSDIPPGETSTIKTQIPLSDDLGRYKANLSLKYGENQTASLYDTTFFYLMPVNLMAILFGIVLVVSLFVVLLFRKVFFVHDDEEDFDEVTVYVKDGHEANPKDHDLDLKINQ